MVGRWLYVESEIACSTQLRACCAMLGAGVNGWISRREDFQTMWQGLEETDAEIYAVVWETKVPTACPCRMSPARNMTQACELLLPTRRLHPLDQQHDCPWLTVQMTTQRMLTL